MKNHFTLKGRKFECKVINGEPIIEGLSIDEFLKKHPELVEDAAYVCAGFIDGTLPANSPQIAANCLHAARTRLN